MSIESFWNREETEEEYLRGGFWIRISTRYLQIRIDFAEWFVGVEAWDMRSTEPSLEWSTTP